MPLRLYSLATLHRGGWGTRKTVEVRLSPLSRVPVVGGLIGPEPGSALAREAATSGRGALTVLPPLRAASPAPAARHRKPTRIPALSRA